MFFRSLIFVAAILLLNVKNKQARLHKRGAILHPHPPPALIINLHRFFCLLNSNGCHFLKLQFTKQVFQIFKIPEEMRPNSLNIDYVRSDIHTTLHVKLYNLDTRVSIVYGRVIRQAGVLLKYNT